MKKSCVRDKKECFLFNTGPYSESIHSDHTKCHSDTMSGNESLGLNDTIIPAITHNDLLMISCVHPKPGPDYFCGSRPVEGTFGDVASHCITKHKESVLTFNKRVLCASSGKISRQAIDYKYIPSDIEKHGYILKVDRDRLTVE